MKLESRYQSVLARIHSQNVKLVAVSKKQSLQKIINLYKLGHRIFAESYVQEAINKIKQTKALDIQWHFIGAIQSNKTKFLAQYFDWVQSIDSLKILNRLNKHRSLPQKPLNVLLQLKVGGEFSKRGLAAEQLLQICAQYKTYKNLTIRGLMSIPAPTSDYKQQLTQFMLCQQVFQDMQKILPVDTLSIGMSGDLEAAMASGATMVRIGTDIFGQRQ